MTLYQFIRDTLYAQTTLGCYEAKLVFCKWN